MIKGVSRKIVEVNNPDSLYFEKAVFYLKPSISQLPEKILTKEAECYMSEFTPVNSENNDNKFFFSFPSLCIALSIIVLIVGTVYSLV